MTSDNGASGGGLRNAPAAPYCARQDVEAARVGHYTGQVSVGGFLREGHGDVINEKSLIAGKDLDDLQREEYLRLKDDKALEEIRNPSQPSRDSHLSTIWKKMRSFRIFEAFVLGLLAVNGLAATLGARPNQIIQPYKRAPLQDIVTWDEHSLFVHGERVMFYSGEFHPFRLPVPSLWLDVFQKIKALGYNGVSFYVDWALLEGKPGNFTAEGVFAFQPFFDAAKEAGIYLLARPGPYINAEASGGGFPGWLQRVKGTLRSADADYLAATDNYAKNINTIIAKAQITNGGPVILYQPENEYSGAKPGEKFPDPNYMEYVYNQAHSAGIVVPLISNDASPGGHNAPGQPAPVDIYGHDGYPLGFDCANPTVWPNNALPTNWHTLHEQQSPNTPYSIVEFQGGSFDPWGGLGFAQCGQLINSEFERVFYKNDFSFGLTIFNIYMTFGGTNWGNLGHPGGYTSYDYAAVISEERLVNQEKYSQAKLLANFLRASGSNWLTNNPGNGSNGTYTGNAALYVTPLTSEKTGYYVIRHAAYNTLASTSYMITLPTSQGNITIPQSNGTLTLNGRDSKIYVTDYSVGDYNLLYSTAEIFTHQTYSDKTILIAYGGPGEYNEMAFTNVQHTELVEGAKVTTMQKGGATVIGFTTSSERSVVQVGQDLFVYLVSRNQAYNYWVLDAPPNPLVNQSTPVVINGGYLMRTAEIKNGNLAITGDLNETTTIEVIGGVDQKTSVSFNGQKLSTRNGNCGMQGATVQYKNATTGLPNFGIPSLNSLPWKYVDTLPEITTDYSDAAWLLADHKTSNNSVYNLTTPTSLFSSDYGYHTGTLLYRGHFTANGNEKTIYLKTQGGSAYGFSAWVNSTYLGSWPGADYASNSNQTFTMPNLKSGSNYVVTVVIDNMGLDENWVVGYDLMKNPRGILDYDLAGHAKSDVTWKLTGNLGGEDYKDFVRGPLNEGGMWAERQGYHLPGAPTSSWKDSKGPVIDGISSAGIGWFATSFNLNMPKGYDIPLSFSFANTTTSPDATTVRGSNSTSSEAATAYRVQLYVNGWQFGKYVHNVGPQDSFPVPEGIFNYHGSNYVAMSLWSLEKGGAKLDGLELTAGPAIQTGYGEVQLSPQSAYEKRQDAY